MKLWLKEKVDNAKVISQIKAVERLKIWTDRIKEKISQLTSVIRGKGWKCKFRFTQ